MQYYKECMEIQKKLLSEVKKHRKVLENLNSNYLEIRRKYLMALEEFDGQKEHMSPLVEADNNMILAQICKTLSYFCNERIKVSKSLIITIEYHLSRINGCVKEFKCEIDRVFSEKSEEIEKTYLDIKHKADFDPRTGKWVILKEIIPKFVVPVENGLKRKPYDQNQEDVPTKKRLSTNHRK